MSEKLTSIFCQFIWHSEVSYFYRIQFICVNWDKIAKSIFEYKLFCEGDGEVYSFTSCQVQGKAPQIDAVLEVQVPICSQVNYYYSSWKNPEQ